MNQINPNLTGLNGGGGGGGLVLTRGGGGGVKLKILTSQ